MHDGDIRERTIENYRLRMHRQAQIRSRMYSTVFCTVSSRLRFPRCMIGLVYCYYYCYYDYRVYYHFYYHYYYYYLYYYYYYYYYYLYYDYYVCVSFRRRWESMPTLPSQLADSHLRTGVGSRGPTAITIAIWLLR